MEINELLKLAVKDLEPGSVMKTMLDSVSEEIIKVRDGEISMIVPNSDGFKLEKKQIKKSKRTLGKKGIHISGDKKHQRFRDKAEILRTPIQDYDYQYLDGLEDMIKEDHTYQFSTFKDLKEYLLKLKLEEDPDWERNRDFQRMIKDI